MLSELFQGLSYLGNPAYWMAFGAAVAMAAFVGLVPGVSATLVMALSIPFVVLNISDPLIGLVMLATLTGVDNTLDSIPAILLGQPGASTQVTFLEGNQLAQRGLAAYTLGAVYAVSAMGGVVGAIALAIVIPVIKPFILAFGFPEIAGMALFGVAMVAALSTGAMVKGIIAAMLGILLATIGIDPITGTQRFTFGELWLWDGLPLIATTLGVFALPEMIDLTMTRRAVASKDAVVNNREVFRGVLYGLSRWRMTIRQSLFGVFLGAVPGIGSAVVDWLSYAFGIAMTKGDRSQFGKGSIDGVLFAESAQNSKEGGQAIPTLAFGIPGGRAWAFVVVAMIAYGVTPGPPMLDRFADITIMMVFSIALGNVAVTVIGMFMTGQLAKLTKIPYPFIGSIIIPISFLSAFQDTRHISAMFIVLGGAVLGIAMKQWKWPRPPLLIGFILGSIIERNLQSALSIHGAVGMMTRPLTIALFVLAIVTAVVFTKMANSSAAPPAEYGGRPAPQPTIPGGASPETLLERLRGRHFGWGRESLFTIAMAALALAFVIGAYDYPNRARFLPMTLGGAVVAMVMVQFVMEGLRYRSGEIMDIGMRSAGVTGAWISGAKVLGLIGLFLLFVFLIGMKYGAIIVAAAGPLLLLEGRGRWIGSAIAGLLVAIFNFVLLDRIMAVIWPEASLGIWLKDLVS